MQKSASRQPQQTTSTPSSSSSSKIKNRMMHRRKAFENRKKNTPTAFDSSDDDVNIEADDVSDSDESIFSTRRTFLKREEDEICEKSPDRSPLLVEQKKSFSSEQNKWIPANFIENTCYESLTGTLLSKENCERNIRGLLKKKRPIDFYDILKSGNTTQNRTLSFALFMINQLMQKKEPNETSDSSTLNSKSVPFNVEKAREVDIPQTLPGGKQIQLSMLIMPSMCSNWVGKSAVSKAIISICEAIKVRDEYFLIYSAPDSTKKTAYPSLSQEFFVNFSNVLVSGFNMPNDSASLVTVVSTVKTTIRNYMQVFSGVLFKLVSFFSEKHRGKMLEDPAKVCEQFYSLLEVNPSFRAEEAAVENCQEFSKRSPRKLCKRKLPILPSHETPKNTERRFERQRKSTEYKDDSFENRCFETRSEKAEKKVGCSGLNHDVDYTSPLSTEDIPTKNSFGTVHVESKRSSANKYSTKSREKSSVTPRKTVSRKAPQEDTNPESAQATSNNVGSSESVPKKRQRLPTKRFDDH